jgi:hypothetical protein
MKFLNKIQGEYDNLCNLIIRPSRLTYQEKDIDSHISKHIKVKRTGFSLINSDQKVFAGSHFVPTTVDTYPCVIYLHGNSSNQTEG